LTALAIGLVLAHFHLLGLFFGVILLGVVVVAGIMLWAVFIQWICSSRIPWTLLAIALPALSLLDGKDPGEVRGHLWFGGIALFLIWFAPLLDLIFPELRRGHKSHLNIGR
jgi:hypothetical protein